ncbi:unnamed protein product [Leuciscus chuanchicus]
MRILCAALGKILSASPTVRTGLQKERNEENPACESIKTVKLNILLRDLTVYQNFHYKASKMSFQTQMTPGYRDEYTLRTGRTRSLFLAPLRTAEHDLTRGVGVRDVYKEAEL